MEEQPRVNYVHCISRSAPSSARTHGRKKTSDMRRHGGRVLAGCLLLAVTTQCSLAFLAPPAALAPRSGSHSAGQQQQQPTSWPRPARAAALFKPQSSSSGSGNENPDANTPGVGGMPDLESVMGQAPMPLGGEAVYEGYQSEYTDQQAVRACVQCKKGIALRWQKERGD